MRTMNRRVEKRAKSKWSYKVIIPIVSVIAVILFFSVALLSMHMTGEDILHKVTSSKESTVEVIAKTYKTIPRIGELYQRSIMPLFSYTTTIGSDLLFRVVDIILCFLAVFICAAVILGHKPGLKLQDSIILLVSFLALVCYNASEIFTMRFSYLHNYVPIIILVSAIFYVLLRQKAYSKKILAIDAILATLCGMSNEIAPIALVFICILLLLINRKYEQNKNTRNRLFAVLIGLCLGLVYLFSSGSILSRAGSSYGDAYDYVSYFKVFSAPVYVVKKSILHIIYNSRHLFLPLVLLTTSTTLQFKKKKYRLAKRQMVCLLFSMLYILGVSQINILDDMESRLLSPAYLGIVIGLGMLLPICLKNVKKDKNQRLAIICVGLLVASFASVVDIAYMRLNEHRAYAGVFDSLEATNEATVCITNDNAKITTSNLYSFKTYSPFEPWTTNYSTQIVIYDKDIYYEEKCE